MLKGGIIKYMKIIKKLLSNFCLGLYLIPFEFIRKILRACIVRLENGQAFSNNLRIIMKKYYGIEIGIGTYGACFNPDQVWTGKGNLIIGKYCSFAKGVCFYSRNHPYWNPSTSPLFYNATFAHNIRNDTVPYGKLTIGNDVWIGQYALILPSCNSIGDGAVIGAGAIVTKNVPDYAVVVGNPAKIIKYRFDEQTIKKIKETKWWDYDMCFLKNHVTEFQDLDSFFKLMKTSNLNNKETMKKSL